MGFADHAKARQPYGGFDSASSVHPVVHVVEEEREANEVLQRIIGGISNVLREGMANDTHDVPGYYFGTSTGHLFASNDDAGSWTEIAGYLPPISSVEVAVLY